MLAYPARIEFDHDGEKITFPDFPDAEALFREFSHEGVFVARKYLRGAIAKVIASRRPVPSPSAPAREELMIPVPASTAAKIRLHNAMLEKGIRRSELADRLSQSDEYLHELLDVRRATRTADVDEAIDAVGGAAAPTSVEPFQPFGIASRAAEEWQPTAVEPIWPDWVAFIKFAAFELRVHEKLDEHGDDAEFRRWLHGAFRELQKDAGEDGDRDPWDPGAIRELFDDLVADNALNDKFHARQNG